MCTKQRLSAAAASATCFHGVSGFFFFHLSPPPLQQQHIVKRKKHKRPESVCPRINWLWWAPLGWSLAALDEERSWAPWLQLETPWTRRWPRALVDECAAARSKHLSESEEFRKSFIVKWIQVSHWRSFKFLSWSNNWQQDLDCDSDGTHIHQWQRTTKPRRRHSKDVFQLCHHGMSGSRCRVRPHQWLRQICSHKAKFYQTKHHLSKQSFVTELPAAFINRLCSRNVGHYVQTWISPPRTVVAAATWTLYESRAAVSTSAVMLVPLVERKLLSGASLSVTLPTMMLSTVNVPKRS